MCKSEFQSPLPPHELRFSTGAATEIACFVDGVLGTTGAAASSIEARDARPRPPPKPNPNPDPKPNPNQEREASATAVHVHVNVTNPSAGGRVLSALQLCDVLFWWVRSDLVSLTPTPTLTLTLTRWVRFDLVTQTFARPWMWAEPSCAPLYATGAEMGTLERSWEAPDVDDPGDGGAGGAGAASCGHGAAGAAASATSEEQRRRLDDPEVLRRLGDVPTFLRAAHAIANEEGFAELPEAQQRYHLFGREGPAAKLGRYCSLNLQSVAKYGTVEVRRQHGLHLLDLYVYP